MINFELSYNVVTKGRIFFIEEQGFISEIRAIESDIIRTIEGKYGKGIFLGFLNLGTIEIVTIGSMEQIGTIEINFINDPEKTALNIENLLIGNNNVNKNLFLQNILDKLGINFNDIGKLENQNKISKFLHDNNIYEENEFKNSDSKKKEEIKEVFDKYYNYLL